MLKKALNWCRENKALIILLSLAALLRVFGNGFGLPDEFNVDETHFVPRAIRFGAGDLNPHWFFYPPLYTYSLFALYGGYFVIGRVIGIFHSSADFGMQYFLDPTAFYLIGRTLTAALGVATVWATAALGSRAYSRAAGFAAAVMLTFCALHVEHSHYITSDVPMTALVTLSLLLSCRYCESGHARDLALAGFAAGLAMAVKYTGVLAFAGCAFAAASGIIARPGEKKSTLSAAAAALAASGAALAAGFIIGCPWIILDHTPVVADIKSTARNISGAWLGQEEQGSMWIYVFTGFLRPGMGLPMLAVTLAGFVYAAVRRTRADFVLAGYTAAFYLWVAHYPHYGYARYWIAVLPPLCLMGGRLLAEAAEKAPSLKGKAMEAAGVAALAAAAVSGVQAVQSDDLMTRPSTRTLARRWFATNVPPHTRVAVESQGPMLRADRASVEGRGVSPEKYEAARIAETMSFDLLNKGRRPWAEISLTNKKYHFMALERMPFQYFVFNTFSLAEYPFEFYASEGYQYLAVNSGMYDRYYAAAKRFPKAVAFYRKLEKECPPPPGGPVCELAAKFEPVPGKVQGDTMLVYRIKTSPPPPVLSR